MYVGKSRATQMYIFSDLRTDVNTDQLARISTSTVMESVPDGTRLLPTH